MIVINYVSFSLGLKIYFLKSLCPRWYFKRPISRLKGERNINMTTYASELADLLRCSVGTANLLLTRNKKLLSLNLNSVHEVATFCRNNFKLSEVIELPAVMSLSHYVLNDRASTLRELGCPTVTAGNVVLFNQFMKETPRRLQKNGFLTFPRTCFIDIVSELKCPDDLKLKMSSRLMDLYSNDCRLSEMKASVNAMYLAWKLACLEEDIMDILHRHSSLSTKSLLNLQRICDMLIENFQFPRSKIYNSPSLLTLDCGNLEELILKVPKICGVNIQHVARKNSLILRRSATALYDTACVLESHGVTDAQLLSCPRILCCSASTVLSRLDLLGSMENLDTLKNKERFLWLIFHFGNINKSAKIIEDLNVPCSSDLLDDVKICCEEKSRSNFSRSGMRDVCFYLAILFGNTAEEIKIELKRYPKIYFSSGQNAQEIVEYLTAQGITKEQLWNGLGIVLYDSSVVIQYFMGLPNRKDLYPPFSEWIGHPNLIQLLIYTIEKDQKFTGCGVYVQSTKRDAKLDENEEAVLPDVPILN